MSAGNFGTIKPQGSRGGRKQVFDDMVGVMIPVGKLPGVRQSLDDGVCDRCHRPYRKTQYVFDSDEGGVVGVNCCANKDDIPEQGFDLGDIDDMDGREWVSPAKVMPPNMTKADMCTKCFQIPAANGVCGC